MAAQNDGTGSEGLTVDQSVPVFEALLSAEEKSEERETPPAQESPEPDKPVDAEASTEQADAEGESKETEQTEETTDETPATETLDPSTKVKLKIDGKDTEVTLEEALKGYSRTQDYTRKTQELADKRKAFEAEDTAVRAERVRVAEYLTQLEQVIAEVTPKEPDWVKIAQENPAEYAVKRAEWDQHKQDVAEVQKQRAAAVAKVQEDQARIQHDHIETERQKLLEAIPTWKDEAVAKAEKAKLVAFAQKAGYPAEELAMVTDHKALVLLHKAMMWDESQEKKPAVKARIEKVITAKPGTTGTARPPVTDQTRLLQRLAKTGTHKDAAAFFESIL